MSRLFREASLDKISSPERLDMMVRLTSARSWLLTAFFLLITISLLLWGFLGSIPTTVNCNGIIISSGKMKTAVSYNEGIITDLSVKSGEIAEKGDVIARVYNKAVFTEMVSLQQQIDQLKLKIETVQKSALPGSLQEMEEKLNALLLQAEDIKAELADNKITAPTAGKVVNILTDKGAYIQAGQEVCTIQEMSDHTLEDSVIAYVPVVKGQTLEAGMTMKVYPTAFNRQEYGHMEALVLEVSDHVITSGEMMERLGNEELTNMFMGRGALVEVRANLRNDSASHNGYYWSNNLGRNVKLPENAICDISITTDRNRPITFLIPLLKDILEE